MSRTKRFYNKQNKMLYEWKHDLGWIPFWHPWKHIWNNKSHSDEQLMSKRRREFNKITIVREVLNLCTEMNHCSNFWFPFECKDVEEILINNFKLESRYPGKWW